MKNNMKPVKNKNALARFHVLLCVIIVSMLLAACSKSEQQVNADEDIYESYIETHEVYTEPPALSPVEVLMDDYSFTYAGEKALIISTEETDKGLEFFVELSKGRIPIFTLIYDSQEGDIVTVLLSESGNQIPVAFLMHEMPEELSEEDEQNFILAQEAVNEIVDSIKLK